MKDFKRLIVWQKSIFLAKEIYIHSQRLPKSELFGLVSQMQRAAVSIPANIAEGSSRTSLKEYCHFLEIALGSAFELDTHLVIISQVYPDEDIVHLQNSIIEIQKMLNTLHSRLKSKL